MLNYFELKVPMHRYFIGFVFANLAFGIGRPAVLKQLSKNIGALHF